MGKTLMLSMTSLVDRSGKAKLMGASRASAGSSQRSRSADGAESTKMRVSLGPDATRMAGGVVGRDLAARPPTTRIVRDGGAVLLPALTRESRLVV